MGEIQEFHSNVTFFDEPHISQKLVAVIRDWVYRCENDDFFCYFYESSDPISIEHLRIAKAFLTSSERR